ncbi:MAG TPA: hypothetical protein VJL59_17140, partial [Anaerolineales bacterium]|nr:hypothetical protein [Anaerolineales bacterium]
MKFVAESGCFISLIPAQNGANGTRITLAEKIEMIEQVVEIIQVESLCVSGRERVNGYTERFDLYN